MTMHIADTLKTLITIIISAISTALTELVKNTTFLFKGEFVSKKDIFCNEAGLTKQQI